jgi:hypothetical protein
VNAQVDQWSWSQLRVGEKPQIDKKNVNGGQNTGKE